MLVPRKQIGPNNADKDNNMDVSLAQTATLSLKYPLSSSRAKIPISYPLQNEIS